MILTEQSNQPAIEQGIGASPAPEASRADQLSGLALPGAHEGRPMVRWDVNPLRSPHSLEGAKTDFQRAGEYAQALLDVPLGALQRFADRAGEIAATVSEVARGAILRLMGGTARETSQN